MFLTGRESAHPQASSSLSATSTFFTVAHFHLSAGSVRAGPVIQTLRCPLFTLHWLHDKWTVDIKAANIGYFSFYTHSCSRLSTLVTKTTGKSTRNVNICICFNSFRMSFFKNTNTIYLLWLCPGRDL